MYESTSPTILLKTPPEGLRPRSATGRPAGAVPDALLRRELATSYRAFAR